MHSLTQPRGSTGFTLIELLIVIAIIGIIAAIAIPNLLRSRMSANEVSAQGACRTLTAAEVDWHTQTNPHTFTASLNKLSTGQFAGGVSYIDPQLGSGIKSGYTFWLEKGGHALNGTYQNWTGAAWPIAYRSTGVRSFYCDETGVVRGVDVGGTKGTLAMPGLD